MNKKNYKTRLSDWLQAVTHEYIYETTMSYILGLVKDKQAMFYRFGNHSYIYAQTLSQMEIVKPCVLTR